MAQKFNGLHSFSYSVSPYCEWTRLARGRDLPLLQEFLNDKNLFAVKVALGLQTDCKQPLHPPRHSRRDNRTVGKQDHEEHLVDRPFDRV